MKKYLKLFIICIFILTLGACSAQGKSFSEGTGLDYASLDWQPAFVNSYADKFSVEAAGSYRLIHIAEGGSFLIVEEGAEVPNNLPQGTAAITRPISNVYLSSSSVFDLLRELGVLDRVSLSGTKESDIYVEEVASYFSSGQMVYAGKYSDPDYELMISKGCKLAIENTMIYHKPDTKEKLEGFGIPVLVERSSYESHPLGRLEWIKLYGVLFDKEEEALEYYDSQLKLLEPVLGREGTGKTAAFFYVNTNGAVNVRRPGDYIPKMMELAGGSYILQTDLGDEESAASSMNMELEDFYLAAKEADIIIYNGNITGSLDSVDQLVAKSPLFADFKAVKEGRVYCTGKNLFQETTAIAELIEDFSLVFRGLDGQGYEGMLLKQMQKIN